MAFHKELNGKEDFDQALASDKYVFLYFYEGEIPEIATVNAKKHEATTDSYSINVGEKATAKEQFKITKVPTAIIYKGGQEIKRIEEMNPEAGKEIEQLLSS